MNKRQINKQLDPIHSFSRGALVGVCALQGLQLVTPDLMMVHAWPWWLRGIVGAVFLLMAANYVLRQRGLMLMQQMARD